MDSYKIVTTKGEKLIRKFELVGFTSKMVSVTEVTDDLLGEGTDTVIIEDSVQNGEILEHVKRSEKYKYVNKYEGHYIFTNDQFVDHLVYVGFKPKSILYFDNFPEARIDLARVFMPVVIRPYGVSDPEYIRLVREYGKGQDAIYDCLERSPYRHIILESYR